MALSEGQITRICDSVGAAPHDRALAMRLRTAFPGLLVTVCADEEVVGVEPVWRGPGFNLYLVGGSGDCLRLTRDPATAAGVVIATLETG